MQLDIDKEVAKLQRMTVGDLRERFKEVWGEPTHTRNKPWLIKRIAWKMLSNIDGDISERARLRAAELARGNEIRTTILNSMKPSTKSAVKTVGKSRWESEGGAVSITWDQARLAAEDAYGRINERAGSKLR